MVSFNHDVSSLTRKDPALKYNLGNRPSSRSAAPAGPTLRPHTQTPHPSRGGERGTRAPSKNHPGDLPDLGEPPGAASPRLLPGDGPGAGSKATEGSPRSSGTPRRDTAVAPQLPTAAPSLRRPPARRSSGTALPSPPRGSCPWSHTGGFGRAEGTLRILAGDGCWAGRDEQALRAA